MSAEIILTYMRVGQAYDGSVEAFVDPPGEAMEPPAPRTSIIHSFFRGNSFKEMLTELCHAAEIYAGPSIILTQTTGEGATATEHSTQLSEHLVKELMRDPAHVADLLSVESRTVYVRDAPFTLRAGIDALADTFGDVVYCRADAIGTGHIECPGCGRWSGRCNDCSFLRQTFAGEYQGEWLGVSVAMLLGSDQKRFYLPRKWNEFGQWITKDALAAKYEKFNKERLT
jgi:hypothetical protein